MIKWLLLTTLAGSMASLLLIWFRARLVKSLGGTGYYYVSLLALLLFVLPLDINVTGIMPQRVLIEERSVVKQAVVSEEAASASGEASALPVPAGETRISSFTMPTAYQWGIGIWACGFVFMLGRYIAGYVRFRKKVLGSKPVDKAGGLDVVVSGFVHSPMLIGFLKPVIVVPDIRISDADYKLALRHEYAHYQQKDAWFKLAAAFINSLHWFNPVTYYTLEAISEACEYSCDEKVTKHMSSSEKKRYSEMILNFAANTSPALSSSLLQNKKQLYRRFELIMRTTVTRKKLAGGVIAGGIIALSVTASSLAFAEGPKPVSEYGGAIKTYYNTAIPLEDNVLSTLGTDNSTGKFPVRVTDGALYIDVNGRKIDTYNRTEPYYRIGREWKSKHSADVKSMTAKTMIIEGNEIEIAFAGAAAAYRNDKVIEQMIRNQITFELGYQSSRKPLSYDHQAFIHALIEQGVYVIQEVTTPDKFKFDIWKKPNGDSIGWKMRTRYDQKNKMTAIYNQKAAIPKDIDGGQGVQLGGSFVIKNGETLAIDIKETTDTMPTVNWAIVNVTTGETTEWMPAASSGYRYIYTPGENNANHTFRVLFSGEESDSADIEIFTYSTGNMETGA